MSANYSHLVHVDADTRMLVIYRVYGDARRELLTQVELPVGAAGTDRSKVDEFCRLLGENLLLDSSVARQLLDL